MTPAVFANLKLLLQGPFSLWWLVIVGPIGLGMALGWPIYTVMGIPFAAGVVATNQREVARSSFAHLLPGYRSIPRLVVFSVALVAGLGAVAAPLPWSKVLSFVTMMGVFSFLATCELRQDRLWGVVAWLLVLGVAADPRIVEDHPLLTGITSWVAIVVAWRRLDGREIVRIAHDRPTAGLSMDEAGWRRYRTAVTARHEGEPGWVRGVVLHMQRPASTWARVVQGLLVECAGPYSPIGITLFMMALFAYGVLLSGYVSVDTGMVVALMPCTGLVLPARRAHLVLGLSRSVLLRRTLAGVALLATASILLLCTFDAVSRTAAPVMPRLGGRLFIATHHRANLVPATVLAILGASWAPLQPTLMRKVAVCGALLGVGQLWCLGIAMHHLMKDDGTAFGRLKSWADAAATLASAPAASVIVAVALATVVLHCRRGSLA